MTKKKDILVFAPRLEYKGGMELENIGFVNTLAECGLFNVTFFCVFMNSELRGMVDKSVKIESFTAKDMIYWWTDRAWYKILFKHLFNFKDAKLTYVTNSTRSIKSYTKRIKSSYKVILINFLPTNTVGYLINFFSNQSTTNIVMHDVQGLQFKYRHIYKLLSSKDTMLISSSNRIKNLPDLKLKCHLSTIRQWVYADGNKFDIKNRNLNHEFVFGTIARLVPEKDILLLLRAASILKDKGYNQFKVVIRGDGDLKKEFEQYILDKELNKIVDLRNGIPFALRYNAYKEFNIFICTSISEGGPITTIEALAAGLPIITTDVGDAQNRVKEDKNGYILTSHNEEELATMMEKYLIKPELVQQHASASRIIYITNFLPEIAKKIFVSSIVEASSKSLVNID
jgi:glycosyltransferase involved in cell wall biosynthesis